MLGLSSVGLSTKAGKRTVGFMGVGFKAVYKRYARVTVSDGTWCFEFNQGASGNSGAGWVLLPRWAEDQAAGGKEKGQIPSNTKP